MGVVKEINLIPKSKGVKLRNLLPFAAIPFSIFMIAGIFLVVGILQQKKIDTLDNELAGVKDEIVSYSYLNENVKRIEEKRTELQSKKDTISMVEGEKIRVLEFLDKLKSFVPTDVSIAALSIVNGSDINISFKTDNTAEIARLMVKLKEMDAFEKVETDRLPIDDKENTITFNLKLKKNSEQVSVK